MPIGADFLREEIPQDSYQFDEGDISLPGEMVKVEDLPDGSSTFQLPSEIMPMEEEAEKFDENLANVIPAEVLEKIASQLLTDIDVDIESRREWEQAYNLGIKYLGIKVEEFRDYPFAHASSVYDATLVSALLRFWSTARAELFPPQGPSRSQIMGEDSDAIEHLAQEMVKFLNHYLTIMDREYYPDSDRMLWYLGLVGSAVRKIYKDPITGQPKARFIDPQDFIVNVHCKTLLSSDRMTHVLHMSRKEIKLKQNALYYIKQDVPDYQDDFDTESVTTKNINRIEGISLTQSENKSLFMGYETHADLDMEDMGWKDKYAPENDVPLPYIVTILKQTRKVLSVYRNWKPDDVEFKRKPSFILYNYLPGFGIYGIGLAQLLGSSAIGATSIKRQLIDAGMLKNFPGGLKLRGLRVENNDKAIGPSEFWDVETGGLPIRDAIMLMPYNEPSVVLKDLLADLVQQMQLVSNTTETQIADMNSETPVGTTLAMLEVANRVQSSILRSLHMSLSYELELIYEFFKDNMSDTPFQFAHPGGTTQIEKKHFDDYIRIIPVSDPNLTSSTQRILRAEAILRLAQSAPQIHNLKDAYHRMYAAMNVEDIEKLLPPEEEAMPLDPITENMNALNGKPIKAGIEQDHEAHMAVHSLMDIQNLPNMAAHMQEHIAFKFLVDIQHAMGTPMPPPQMLQNPEVQNQVAMMAAQAAQKMKQEHEAKQGPDPNAVMTMDIEQHREQAMLRHEEAIKKIEAEAFKATLKHEEAIKKLAMQKEIADDRNELDLHLAQIKQTKSSRQGD